MSDYTEKRRELEKVGFEYEEFVAKQMLENRKIKLDIFKTKEEQFYIGESAQGYEIKLDRRYRETGNLYIEIGEKAPSKELFTNSGILRNDNTIYYLIGDYTHIFIFSKQQLRNLFYSGTLHKKYNTVMTDTTMGFLLDLKNPLTQFLIIDQFDTHENINLPFG